MAAYMGDRESLQPTGMKRQRRQNTREKPVYNTGPASSESEESSSESEPEAPPPKKRKAPQKKGKVEKPPPPPPVKEESESSEEESGSSEGESEDEDEASENSAAEEDETNTHSSTGVDDWSEADTKKLIERIRGVLPQDDTVKHSTQAQRIDWATVSFGLYTAQDCLDRWLFVTTKLRKFRTMTELVHDAESWVKQPWNTFGKKMARHPDMPKKPLTPYFKFFMANREKYSQTHPNMSVTDISKELAVKFKELTDKKKQKFIDEYNKENEIYKQALGKFKKEHPELYVNANATSQSNSATAPSRTSKNKGLPKSTTAMQIFINMKIEEHIKKHPEATRKELHNLYRTKWNELSDGRKLKYIKKAIEAKQQYDKDMEIYKASFPEADLRISKSFLNKAEQKIMDRYNGKPEKPPPNGYGRFTAQVLPTLAHIPNNERMAEVSRRWKALTEEEREEHNKRAMEGMKAYQAQFMEYLQTLSPEEQQRLEEEKPGKKGSKNNNSNKATAAQQAAQDRPQQPVSALFLFMKEKREKYKKKYANMDHQELTRLMAKEFSALPEDKKAKYKRLESEEKEKLTSQLDDPAETPAPKTPAKQAAKTKGNATKKAPHFPGEPKKPPGSGYQLFSAELLKQLIDLPSRERMNVISEKWKGMSDKGKEEYKKRRDALEAQFKKDLKKFKDGLSMKDKKKYEELEAQREAQRKQRRTRATAKRSASKTTTKKKPEQEEEESEESSSGEEEGEEEEESEAEDGENAEDGEESDGSSSSSESASSSSGESESEDDEDSQPLKKAEPKTPVQNGVQPKQKGVNAKQGDGDEDGKNDASSGSSSSGSGSESGSASSSSGSSSESEGGEESESE